jgi:amino acid adenylation domain-containing protein
MSTVEEQSRVLNEFNRPLEGRPVEATVAQCFEAQVSQSPTAVALVDEGVQYTYEQLHLRSNQVARHLRDICQVKAEDPVAIVLPRGEGMLTAMLGILKAGGAYVPIDPAYPRERIDYMLSDSRCKVVVDDALLATALNGQSHELLSVNDAGHLAYVIYTSGSTGKPKGVMVTHRNVVSFMENFPERFGLRPGMSIGAATNYTFDISVLELLCAVSCGLKVVLLPPSEPQAILTSVAEGQIDCLQVTPSRLTQLLTAAMGQIEALAKLKVLLVGGESLTPDHYDLLSSLPSTRVIHVYGPTETTIWSSSAEVSERVPLSLGTPLLRERIYVLRGDQLCPVGIAGEICISGSGVARGYLHRPEQTREKFVADPFVPGARLYRTGDMGRWNDRGQLIFLGRRDAQVKIRGYRIELGEVENALAGCAGVDAAVVQALPVNGEGLELVAYLVGTAPVDLPSVKEHLSRHLPGYMLPQHYVELPAMPLNASGKVDRRSLPSPQAARSARAVKYAPPRTETEERMVAIWQSILLQKDIGIHDDFFDIGGHSLKATRVLLKVHEIYNITIDVRDIFAYPTVEKLASYVDTLLWIKISNPTEIEIVKESDTLIL